MRTVLGALCIYVLLGLFFVFVYTVIGLAAGSFFVQQATARELRLRVLQLRDAHHRGVRRPHRE